MNVSALKFDIVRDIWIFLQLVCIRSFVIIATSIFTICCLLYVTNLLILLNKTRIYCRHNPVQIAFGVFITWWHELDTYWKQSLLRLFLLRALFVFFSEIL